MHRGRSFIIQIELCRPIDTFSGGGFSNCRHRGSSTRARRRQSAGEFAYGIELFHSLDPSSPRKIRRRKGGGKGTELFLSGALTVRRTGWKIIGRLLRLSVSSFWRVSFFFFFEEEGCGFWRIGGNGGRWWLFFFLSVSSVYLVFILIDRFKTEIRRLNA